MGATGTHYHINHKGGYSMAKFVEENNKQFKRIFLCGEWYSGDNSAEQMYTILWAVMQVSNDL